ncbi:F-box/kelch-repeat protein At3g06240 [Elaeis guineensis]|uniref:F-box/kelch-repeat protein At3g06240 n=1 Tax=Elaeis guineensis var. tenera TaxID=51953 RepID=A0A6I9R557_ELAGV|nr:F-box/kelch-repeat protein At3g06240 [Elaeis guineensis]XP_029119318.1 F-box/kelch-repeat protein At3g06240 [Elaeis guineensis]
MPWSSESRGEKSTAIFIPEKNKRVHSECGQRELSNRKIKKIPPNVMILILSRLPTKSVARFRSVSKLWNSLTCEPSFALQQFRNGPNKNRPSALILSWRCNIEFSLKQFEEGRPLSEKLYFIGPKRLPCYVMTNSCNGLICVLGLRSAIMVNPGTGKVIMLPEGTIACNNSKLPISGGLGFDVSTGEYKVVRFVHCLDLTVACEVLTLGSQSWRRISNAPLPDTVRPPVVVNEAIHWTAKSDRHDGPEVAVSFDIRRETFGVIMHPECSRSSKVGNMVSVVGELAGYLCVSDKNTLSSQMDIWILMDYSQRRWIKQYSINLLAMENCSWDYVRVVKPLTIRDGNILLTDGRGRFDYYDPESGRFRMVMHDSAACGHTALHVESLISPAAVQRGIGLVYGRGNLNAEN